jgi:hypothetical protein
LGGLTDAEHAEAGLCASGHRAHGAGGIGRLRIRVVGAAQRGVGEVFPRQAVFLAGTALALAFQDACGGHRGQAHAVADEQDHVLRPAQHRATRRGLRRAIAEPPGGGLAAGTGDVRDFDDDAVAQWRWRSLCGVAGRAGATGNRK